MADEKIYMLNVLWFKKDGGAAKYAEYAAAAAPFVEELGGRMLDGFAPDLALIGEWNPDLFFIVKWPNWAAFTKLPESDGYRAIAHLREEALEDSLLIRCRHVSGGARPNLVNRPSPTSGSPDAGHVRRRAPSVPDAPELTFS